MVRLDSRNNRAPRWMFAFRRGISTTVGKGRFGEDGKTCLDILFGDFSRLFFNKSDTYHRGAETFGTMSLVVVARFSQSEGVEVRESFRLWRLRWSQVLNLTQVENGRNLKDLQACGVGKDASPRRPYASLPTPSHLAV